MAESSGGGSRKRRPDADLKSPSQSKLRRSTRNRIKFTPYVYTTPSKRRESRTSFVPNQVRGASTSTNNINTNNRFMVGDKSLSDFTDDEGMSDGTVKDAYVSPKQAAGSTQPKKNPPIVITGSNVSAVQNTLNEFVQSKKFELRLMRIGIRVTVADKNEYDQLIVKLKEKQHNFFSYHSPETRPRKIVLFGLHDMVEDDLKKKLESLDVIPKDIKKLRLHGNRYGYDKQGVYLLYFEPGKVKLSDLRKIKHIDNVIVKWEPYQTKSKDPTKNWINAPQCRNCQMYGHSSINCNMQTRCLVCALNHKTDECQKKINRNVLSQQLLSGQQVDRSFIKCANCGECHTANYKGCIARETFLKVQNKFNRKPRNPRNAAPPVLNHDNYPSLGSMGIPMPPRVESSFSEQLRASRYEQYGVQFPSETTNNAFNQQMQLMSEMMKTMNAMLTKLTTLIEVLTPSRDINASANST